MATDKSTENAALNDDADVIARWVEPDPNRPGAFDVRIVDYGVHVWALVGYLEAVNGDINRVAKDYDLPIDAVRAALAYYRQHKEIIDAWLAANAA
jgi:uncharacterized protein (DUF433 family)